MISANLDLFSILLFLTLALIAEIIGTISGFGSSILFVPLAAFFFDFSSVLAITAAFHVASNLFKIALFREGINKNIAYRLGIPAIIAVVLGAFFSKLIPLKELELIMNIFILALAISLVIMRKITLEKSNKNLMIGGLTSGFLAGLVGTGGSIRGLTLAAFGLSKMSFIATSSIIDLGVDGSRAIVYFFDGYFHLEFLLIIALLIPVSYLGTYLGKRILVKIPESKFRMAILSIIITTAIAQTLLYFT